MTAGLSQILSRCQSIHLFPPKKQKGKEFTHRNIRNPGSHQGTQSWKDQYLSKEVKESKKVKRGGVLYLA